LFEERERERAGVGGEMFFLVRLGSDWTYLVIQPLVREKEVEIRSSENYIPIIKGFGFVMMIWHDLE
jgi:hypothetical protein